MILNSRSGRKRRETARRLEEIFARYPGRFTLRVLRSGKEIETAARRAVAERFATIVAAGGDGTISGISAHVAGSESRLGVLPFGTFNYFARSLGLPEDLEAAVDVLVNGTEREMHLGAVNGASFLNNASIGAYAAILQRRERIYKRWGRSRIAAHWSVLVTLLKLRTSQDMVVTVDGAVHRLRTPLIFVANNPFQLDVFGLPGRDCLAEGKLAMFVAPDRTRFALVGYGIRLAFRTVRPDRDFMLLCGREMRIETMRKRRLVARDGERARMTGPFVMEVRAEPLRVVAPPPDESETQA